MILKKKIMIIGITFLMVISLVGCSSNDTKPTSDIKPFKSEVYGAFDTYHVFTAYVKDQETFDQYFKIYETEMNRLHNLYTTFEKIPDLNNLYAVNEQAGIEPLVVDKDIISLLKDAKKWNKEISNVVNVAFGPVLEIWHDARTHLLEVPPMDALKKAVACTNIDDIEINEEMSTVFLKQSCMRLDVGAVAKGYAVELVAQKLIEAGMTAGMISAGGNVRMIGVRPEPDPSKAKVLDACVDLFCVGLERPVFNNEVLDKNNPYAKYESSVAAISAEDMSLVTSGDYQRYFYIEDQVYSHIIDPNTLMPSTHFRAVTIITPNSGLADFMSSVIFILPFEQGKALVESMDDLEAVWLYKDGTIKYSSGLVEGKNLKLYETK